MSTVPPPKHDPIAANLSPADDRVLLSNWLPPKVGVVPKIRIGQRWISVLWALPVGFLLAVMGVAVAQALRELPALEDFLVRYPGAPLSARAVNAGFPAWLGIQHFLNLFFMVFIVRAGIQVLADHPRLYWRRDCIPGTEWFRFSEGCSSRPDMDCEGRRSDLAGLAGRSWRSALHRARPLVASAAEHVSMTLMNLDVPWSKMPLACVMATIASSRFFSRSFRNDSSSTRV